MDVPLSPQAKAGRVPTFLKLWREAVPVIWLSVQKKTRCLAPGPSNSPMNNRAAWLRADAAQPMMLQAYRPALSWKAGGVPGIFRSALLLPANGFRRLLFAWLSYSETVAKGSVSGCDTTDHHLEISAPVILNV